MSNDELMTNHRCPGKQSACRITSRAGPTPQISLPPIMGPRQTSHQSPKIFFKFLYFGLSFIFSKLEGFTV